MGDTAFDTAYAPDAAESPEEIDRERARQALEPAEGLLSGKSGEEEIDYSHAVETMKRAQARLQVAGRVRPA